MPHIMGRRISDDKMNEWIGWILIIIDGWTGLDMC